MKKMLLAMFGAVAIAAAGFMRLLQKKRSASLPHGRRARLAEMPDHKIRVFSKVRKTGRY